MACTLSEPLANTITRHHEPPCPRAGERSKRTWWVCPFHPDRNPSLCVEPGEAHFHCYGCGAHGDAIDFVRRLNPGMSFQEARAAVGGDPPPGRTPRPPLSAPRPEPAPRPEGWQEFVVGIVAEAEAALWSDQGEPARAYLKGRGLSAATIRAARLGYWRQDTNVRVTFRDKAIWVPRGITIPWFEGDRLTMVNVRRPRGSDPKYMAIWGSRRVGIYPSARVILPGKPLMIVEGEFESLLLNQDLAGLVPAITLGGAGDRPKPRVLNSMLGANPWYVAGDSDGAGEKSAEGWLTFSERCRRVRPPRPWKDWTDARHDGLDLREFWEAALTGRTPKVNSGSWVHPDSSEDRLSDDPPRIGAPAHPEVRDQPEPPRPRRVVGQADDVGADRVSPADREVGTLVPPLDRSWRKVLPGWPIEWRQRWGELANRHQDGGMTREESETRAFREVRTERERGAEPPPIAVPPPAEPSVLPRWKCLNGHCRSKGRWWMSAEGVVLCAGCTPPAFASLVVAQGTEEDAPTVSAHRRQQATGRST